MNIHIHTTQLKNEDRHHAVKPPVPFPIPPPPSRSPEVGLSSFLLLMGSLHRYVSLNDTLLVLQVCGLYINGFFTHRSVGEIHTYGRGSCSSYCCGVVSLQESIEMYHLLWTFGMSSVWGY